MEVGSVDIITLTADQSVIELEELQTVGVKGTPV